MARPSITVSIPAEMLAEVDRVSREERRSHSALVREALNRYFHDRFPTVSATRAELRAIARGRAQIAKGEFVTLEKILYDVDASSRKSRRKGTAKAPVS